MKRNVLNWRNYTVRGLSFWLMSWTHVLFPSWFQTAWLICTPQMSTYSLATWGELEEGWARMRLARRGAGERQAQVPSVIGRRRKGNGKCLTAEPEGCMRRRPGSGQERAFPTQTILEQAIVGGAPDFPPPPWLCAFTSLFFLWCLVECFDLWPISFIPDRAPKLGHLINIYLVG